MSVLFGRNDVFNLPKRFEILYPNQLFLLLNFVYFDDQNAKLKNILHQVLSPLDPIKDFAGVTFCDPQHCISVG
jgi:hypothetical protein